MLIALLGASHWHAPCYYNPARQAGHRVVVIDPEASVVDKLASRFGFAGYTETSALDDLEVDLAVCLGPHHRMADYLEACLGRGIPVLAEKPGGLDASRLARLADRFDHDKVFHAAAFSMRWDDTARTLKDLLDSGRLGRVARIGLSYFAGAAGRYPDWGCAWVLDKQAAGGGALFNVGIHLVDLLRFLGFSPSVHSAVASHALNHNPVDDVSTVTVNLGEAYAVIESGYLAASPYGGLYGTVFAEHGHVILRRDGMEVRFADGTTETHDNPDPEPRGRMLEDILAASATGTPPRANLHDLAASLALCLEAQRLIDR